MKTIDYCDCIRFKEKEAEADHLRFKLKELSAELLKLKESANYQMEFSCGLTGSKFISSAVGEA